jgi:hypothetical protein
MRGGEPYGLQRRFRRLLTPPTWRTRTGLHRIAECRKRFEELMQSSIYWGSPVCGFFDVDEWEKEAPPDR